MLEYYHSIFIIKKFNNKKLLIKALAKDDMNAVTLNVQGIIKSEKN